MDTTTFASNVISQLKGSISGYLIKEMTDGELVTMQDCLRDADFNVRSNPIAALLVMHSTLKVIAATTKNETVNERFNTFASDILTATMGMR